MTAGPSGARTPAGCSRRGVSADTLPAESRKAAAPSAPAAPAEPAVVTKAEFARMCGVHPSQVTRWRASGKIDEEAVEVRAGREVIVVERARAQLKARLDVGQRFGNGLGTRLDGPRPDGGAPAGDGAHDAAGGGVADPPAARPAALTGGGDAGGGEDVDDRIKAAKLREIELRNDAAERKRRAEAGLYVRTDDHKAAVAAVVRTILEAVDGELGEMANDVAARCGVPARDVVHAAREGFRRVRAKVADRLARQAEGLPETVEDTDTDTGAAAAAPDGKDGAGRASGGPLARVGAEGGARDAPGSVRPDDGGGRRAAGPAPAGARAAAAPVADTMGAAA